MLYKFLLNAPKIETDPMKATPGPHANGFIGSIVGQVTISMGKVSLQHKNNPPQSQVNTPAADVLSTQTTKPSNQPDSKKKGKNKKKTGGANIGTNDNNTNPVPNKKRYKSKILSFVRRSKSND